MFVKWLLSDGLNTNPRDKKEFLQCSPIMQKNCWMNQYINLWWSETDDTQISHTSQDMLCNALARVEEISHWIKIYLYTRFLIVTIVGVRSLAVVLRIWITETQKIIICQSVHYTRQYEEARKVTWIVLTEGRWLADFLLFHRDPRAGPSYLGPCWQTRIKNSRKNKHMQTRTKKYNKWIGVHQIWWKNGAFLHSCQNINNLISDLKTLKTLFNVPKCDCKKSF